LLRSFVTNNDQDAFAVVVTRHAPLVWGVCRRILGHRQDAEDAFQATFLVLARKAGSTRWQASVGGWLYTVAHRLAVRTRKQAERRRACEREAGRTPRAESSLCELAAVVDEELRRLPAKYRDPLLLHYLEGVTAEMAARQLGLSRGTFYNRLNRGRELLRERLSRQGLSLAAPLLAAALAHEAEAAAPSLIQAALRGATESVPERVATLAAEALRNTLLTKLKIGVALGLLMGAAAGGVAMLTPQAPPSPAPQAERPADPAKAEDKAARRVDRDGDPLPEGAAARLGTRRFRVDAEIEGLAFAPDGKTIAVRGNGGIWLLDAASGKQLRRVDHSGALMNPGIAFSPDGKQLIAPCHVAEKDRVRPVMHFRHVVRVWETTSGRKVRESELNDARWVGWSADGQPLAAYVGKGEMRLRDVATGRERRFPAKDLPDPIQAKVCSCVVGKNVLAASDEKGLVHVWELANGEQRYVLKSGGAYLRSLALSANGRWLASLAQDNAGAYSVRLWDTATGLAVHRVAGDQKYLEEVVFAPDGKMLATVGSTEIRLWDAATGRELRRIPSGGWSRQRIAFAPDGKTLATAVRNSGTSRAIHLWDVAAGTKKPEPEGHTEWPGRPAFSPDGQRVATGGWGEGTIRVWDPSTGEPLLRIHRDEGRPDCAFSADGRTLFSCQGNKLLFVDAATGSESHVLKVEDPDRPKARQSGLNLYLSDDRARLIVFCSDDTHQEMLVISWDIATRKQLFHRRRVEDAHWSVVSADARMLAAPYAGARDGPKTPERIRGKGSMHLEDLATGERLLTFPRLEGQTMPLAFSPDGRLLISDTLGPLPSAPSGWGDTLRLWEVLTASELLVMPVAANTGSMKAAFSPDGRLLALSAPATEILLWNLRRGKELHRFKGFDAQVTSLAFSPDGRRLVSGLSDTTLLVWDVAAVRSKDRPAALDAANIRQAWDDLAADAHKAFAARWTLAAAPEQAVSLLRERLKPAQAADQERLRRLLADLDSEQFAVREKARRELAELGELAEPALRLTLADKPSLEVRRQIQALLDNLRAPVTRPETLRSLRAVAVLEDIGTPEARRVLEQLARGTAEARLTREAKASLRRLDLRSMSSR
jgi:RNA polymerase sigma factor (sigma-70 family)